MSNKFDALIQVKVLAMMVRDKEFMSRNVAYIKPTYFDSAVLVDISRIVIDLFKKYKSVITVNTLLTEVESFVAKFKKSNYEDYLKVIDQVYKDKLVERLYVKDNVAEFINFQEHKGAIAKSIEYLKSGEVKHIKKVMERAFRISDKQDKGMFFFEEEEIDQRMSEDNEEWVASGFPELDACIKGLGIGELSIILAPPNVGKSAVLTIIGASVLKTQGKTVAHFSHEMRTKKVGRRYDRALTGKSFTAIKDDPSGIKQQLVTLAKGFKCNLYIKDYPTRTCTVDDIKAELYYLEGEGFLPKLILTDYAAIMKPSKSRDGRHQEIEEINEELRGLAGEFNCHVMTAAQTTRSAVNKAKITIEDLGESFAQSKVADLIIAVCQTEREYNNKVMRLFIAKNRDFEKFQVIPYRINYETMSIRYDPSILEGQNEENS